MLRKLLILLMVVVLLLALFVVAIDVALVDDDLANCSAPGSDACATADVIVAVSGGDTAARAKRAIQMYQDGWADKIVFSGASADPDSISNAEAMRQIAMQSGVPANAIYLDEHSQDTKENAQNTVAILNDLGVKRAILVSSPYHLRRVKMNFMVADSSIEYRTAAAQDDNWSQWFLTPNGWVIATTELAGIAELSAEVR